MIYRALDPSVNLHGAIVPKKRYNETGPVLQRLLQGQEGRQTYGVLEGICCQPHQKDVPDRA